MERIGSNSLAHRLTSLPGRSVVELVGSAPGWLLEANGVLHPRGSEYQTQFVIDGVPFTENRSPSFSSEFDAEDIQSLTILTANFPAEYGKKLGGVVEVATMRNARPGLHGKLVAHGGSFATSGGAAQMEYAWQQNAAGISARGAKTDRYLDPPVLGNFSNQATTAGFRVHYERDFRARDRLGLIYRDDRSKFLVPNEQIQQSAGQRQDRSSYERTGLVSCQHIFSPTVLGEARGMLRDVSASLSSNPLATPIIAGQARGFREGYFKGSVTAHRGVHEWKSGFETDFTNVRERFHYLITDAERFDPLTPPVFTFRGDAKDREESAFLQDLVRLGKWTLSAGLRWDHYRLVLSENAVSPRLGIARYWSRADLVLRASYDRAFQTPAIENLLLSSSPVLATLNPNFLRMPVRPSHGNFYEIGLTKSFFGKLRLDANYFRRDFDNFADDNLLLNTGVSFPIAFRSASIYGVESKIEIPQWGRISGFLNYSYMFGSGYLPVTGGLFLGEEVAAARASGRFPISQDQRNTVKARFRCQLISGLWIGWGGWYGSGLPTKIEGSLQEALLEFGPEIIERVNFARGRLKPSLSIDASLGSELWRRDNFALRLQADMRNLNNRLNLINFAGLFSGTALAPNRSFAVRLTAEF
jgi:outer membrane receptor protein involved in Fe transport